MSTRAALSTGSAVERRRVEHEFGMYVTPFKAWDEASMLVERNDRGWYCSPQERHNASMALSEALAAFIVADLG